MSNITSSVRSRATVTTPNIYNVSVPLANTEVSQALNGNTTKFTMRSRNKGKIKLSYASSESGTKYFTILKGCSYSEDNLNFTGTLYFQSDVAGDIIEIVEWS